MSNVSIQIKGIDKLRAAFARFPSMVAQSMTQAGDQASNEILNTPGLRNYPPSTAANLPPVPYYIRGRGMQYASHNSMSSEKYKEKWTTKSAGYRTTIGNSASYAPYLAGEQQAGKMAEKGWRKLLDVATEKIPQITKIYQAWVDRALRKAGL